MVACSRLTDVGNRRMVPRRREKGARPIVSPIGQVFTTEEAAQILKTSLRTIQRMIRLGQLKAHRVGRGYRIRDVDLQEFFERGETGGTGK
jgi:excisionase family DNA binding protein